jgi:uncharacterized protein (TIRG00374 family)
LGYSPNENGGAGGFPAPPFSFGEYPKIFSCFQYNRFMRKFIFAVVLLLTVLAIIGRLAEVQAIVKTLQHGDWRFLFLAFIVVAAWMFDMGFSLLSIYRSIGLDEKLKNLMAVAVAAYFVNVIAPTVGMSGMAVFVSEARKRNYSPGKAAVASALYVLLDYAALLSVLAVGFLILFRRNNLNIPEIIASGILLAIAIAMAILIYLGMHSAVQLGKVLSWLGGLVNRILRPFIHRDYLSERRAHEFAYEAAEGLKELSRTPKNLLLPLGLALLKQGLLIGILLLSFLAFQVPVSAGTLVAGYSIGYLFLIISPTPSGLGVVEGVLTLVLSSMYVPIGAAAVVTMAYRGFTFWLPLLIGMIAFRWLGSKGI